MEYADVVWDYMTDQDCISLESNGGRIGWLYILSGFHHNAEKFTGSGFL